MFEAQVELSPKRSVAGFETHRLCEMQVELSHAQSAVG